MGSKGCIREIALFDTGVYEGFTSISTAGKLGYIRYEVPEEMLLRIMKHSLLERLLWKMLNSP